MAVINLDHLQETDVVTFTKTLSVMKNVTFIFSPLYILSRNDFKSNKAVRLRDNLFEINGF